MIHSLDREGDDGRQRAEKKTRAERNVQYILLSVHLYSLVSRKSIRDPWFSSPTDCLFYESTATLAARRNFKSQLNAFGERRNDGIPIEQCTFLFSLKERGFR